VHLLEILVKVFIAYIANSSHEGFASIELGLRDGGIVGNEPTALANSFRDNRAKVRRHIDTKLRPKSEADIYPIPTATSLTRYSAIKCRSDVENSLVYIMLILMHELNYHKNGITRISN